MTVATLSPRLSAAEIIVNLSGNGAPNWLEAFQHDARRGWLFGPDLYPVRASEMLTIAEAMGGWPSNPAAQPTHNGVAA